MPAKSRVTKFRKITNLTGFEFGLLVLATPTLPLVKFLLKQRGFGRTEKFLTRFGPKSASEDTSPERVVTAARMVNIAAENGFYKAQCLEIAITLWWMLHMMGIESTVRLGIYKKDDLVEAHAWVIHSDEIVIGQTSRFDDYQPILDVNVDRR